MRAMTADPNLFCTPAAFGRRCVEVLRPALFTRRAPKQLSATAYLDGLRGFAALLVYWMHHQIWARMGPGPFGDILEYGYGYDGKRYFACLPVVRMFFTGGHIAVVIFFVISGYVLSAKPLRLIQAGELVKLDDNVASALFRRWARLYIPCAVTTFLFATSWHLFNISTFWPRHQWTYRAEVWTWYAEFKNWSFLFRPADAYFFSYNVHLWSIPVEFRGSIMVYATLMALSRSSRNARLCAEVVLIFFFLCVVDGWNLALFIGGMHICDLAQLAERKDLPRIYALFEPYKVYVSYILLILGVLLSGVPTPDPKVERLREQPGWYYLSFLTPSAMSDYKWFYLFFAATFIVASAPNISWLKRFFETRFCQYLGRISFSLYLVHGPLLWTVGNRLYLAAGWPKDDLAPDLVPWLNLYPLPRIGPFGLEPNFLLPQMILLPLTLWVAEMATKGCDEPALKFPRWLYKKMEAPPCT